MVERKKIADPNVRDGIASLLEMEDLSLELPVAKIPTEDNCLDETVLESNPPASCRFD